MTSMVSENLRKIVALIIVTFSFISIPVLMFLSVVMMYFNLNQIIQFYYSRTLVSALTAVSLAIINAILLYAIWVIVRWARK